MYGLKSMRVMPGRQVGELYAVGLAFTPRLGPVTEKTATKIAAVFTQVHPPPPHLPSGAAYTRARSMYCGIVLGPSRHCRRHTAWHTQSRVI